VRGDSSRLGRMRAVLSLILFVNVFAFPQTQDTPKASVVEDVEPYNVYAALIPELLKVGDKPHAIRIQRQTDPLMSKEKLEDLDRNCFRNPETRVLLQALCNDFVEANRKTWLLQHMFPIAETYALKDKPVTAPDQWKDYSDFIFSAVGFDSGKEFALVYADYGCGNMCAKSGLFLLQRVEGHWKTKESRYEMIS
jgi:hypothetical protein